MPAAQLAPSVKNMGLVATFVRLFAVFADHHGAKLQSGGPVPLRAGSGVQSCGGGPVSNFSLKYAMPRIGVETPMGFAVSTCRAQQESTQDRGPPWAGPFGAIWSHLGLKCTNKYKLTHKCTF